MRLLGLYVALIVVFFGAILMIRLIGGTQPNPIAVLFANPDGSPCQIPCLFGVFPGKTTLEDAIRLLDQHPLTHGMNTKFDKQSVFLYSQEASIELSAVDSNVVDRIRLGYRQSDARLPHTFQLAWLMQQANLGNQTLYFGKIGDGFGRGDQPPYLTMYYYYDGQIGFQTVQWNDSIPWQAESFKSLTIYTHVP